MDELEKRLKELPSIAPEELGWELVRIYGFAESSIKRTKNSQLKKKENQIIFKQKLFFERFSSDQIDSEQIDFGQTDFDLTDSDLTDSDQTVSGRAISDLSPARRRVEELNAQKQTHSYKPRFIVATDGKTIAALDTRRGEWLDTSLELLWRQADFFMPWLGREKYQIHHEDPADVKAAEKMAKIYEEIARNNSRLMEEEPHALNIFLTRLLFCFFAEDTGIFPEENLFTRTMADHTRPDGSDLKRWFETLFLALDSREKDDFPSCFQKFPYVNGNLFSEKGNVPLFTGRCRTLIRECGELDWRNINPDIFGSMFQAVASPKERDRLGQHYTSVPNIMKVIGPLFLNELREEFEKARESEKKLRALLERLQRICLFDPACGSGNFLIIAYKQMRSLEIDVLERIAQLTGQRQIELDPIPLANFYGVEIDDFARETAILSLWLAEHQMNARACDRLGRAPATLPLKPSGNILCANALRVNWEEVCPKQRKMFSNQTPILLLLK